MFKLKNKNSSFNSMLKIWGPNVSHASQPPVTGVSAKHKPEQRAKNTFTTATATALKVGSWVPNARRPKSRPPTPENRLIAFHGASRWATAWQKETAHHVIPWTLTSNWVPYRAQVETKHVLELLVVDWTHVGLGPPGRETSQSATKSNDNFRMVISSLKAGTAQPFCHFRAQKFLGFHRISSAASTVVVPPVQLCG